MSTITVATPATVLDVLESVRDVPLDSIPLDEAQRVRRRIIDNESDVAPTEVSAFGSYV